MKDEEKKLIENLFYRLKNTELNSFERDVEANNLIQDLVKKQPYSSYYMAQTILIQETAIKKLSLKVEELNKTISNLNKTTKKSSFLSSFFKKEPISSETSSNAWKSNPNITGSYNQSPTPSSTISSNVGATNNNNSFLKNALQTATGVAGGMILGNMLMNIFNHRKPEEEVFDTINESFISNIGEDEFYRNNENDLVDYSDKNHFDISQNTSNFNDEHINEISNANNIHDTNDIHDMNDIQDMNDIHDMNDDNFI